MTTQTQAESESAARKQTPKRILSGMRPTGPLHLGHLIGVIDNWREFQSEYDCYFMVADWHALTSEYSDSSKLPEFTRGMILEWLAAGLDPERSTLFIQSQVKQHAELALILGMFTPIPWLERCPSFKDQQEQLKEKDLNSFGFLGYPVLQAADIILYKANAVPVGEDQLAHLEVCREIIRRLHHLQKTQIFPEPKPILSHVPKLLGFDGRKMSKSYGNSIYLKDTPKEVEAKVREMVTDPARVRREDPGTPEICSVYDYHKIFTKEECVEIAEGCRSAQIGCVQCKKKLAASLDRVLDPIRTRRAELENQHDMVDALIERGNAQARETAESTMQELRQALSLPN